LVKKFENRFIGDCVPTVEFSINDLEKLVGKRIYKNKIEDIILYAKGEIENIEDGMVTVDIKDTNRPDLWSVEGIAREISARLKGSLPKYKVHKSNIILNVMGVKARPKIVAAIVKNLSLDDYAIKQMIQLQEKVSQTYGRNRCDVAIGIYDFDKIKPPIFYKNIDPKGIKFVPLDFDEAMTPEEILKLHPKGIEFSHLLKGFSKYPLLIDSKDNVLSMPPIINSNYTGKVTEETKNVFVEVTGHDVERISTSLNVIVTALADRGGKIYDVKIRYGKKEIVTPILKEKRCIIDPEYCRRVLGLEINDKQIIDLLNRSSYRAKKSGKKIIVEYPAYRNDIMHQRDVIEDIAISYGYNKMKPELPKIQTIGRYNELENFIDLLREVMLGFGLQEILTFSLTSKDRLFEKMNVDEECVVEIENPVSKNWSSLRNWLLPSLMEFLSRNKHVDYPQKIFEIGNCVLIDKSTETKTKDVKKLAVVISDSIVNYEQISSLLDAFMRTLGLKYQLIEKRHGSFIDGRCANIMVTNKDIGIVGEINPIVLENWKLEKPVIAFELNISEIFKIIKED